MTNAEMHAAFLKAQAAFPVIPKTRTAKIATKSGGTYSYAYADLVDILRAVAPVLHDNGFALVQSVTSSREQVGVQTRLLHESGEFIMGDYLYLNAGSTPQDAGSAITYARRYSLSALLGIATEDDADGQVSPAGDERTGHRETPTGDTPSKKYPVDPLKCDHKKTNGDWVKWDDADCCPKCGLNRITAMEGTTADLGPAEGYGGDSPGVHQP